MTDENKITPQDVRAWLDGNATAQPVNMRRLYEGMGTAAGEARRAIAVVIRDATRAGFLVRIETTSGPVYQVTGKGMPREVLSPEERGRRRKERDARRVRTGRKPSRPSRAVRIREARVAIQAANTPVPAVPKPKVRAETVEQFEARGGKVEILSTHWGLAA